MSAAPPESASGWRAMGRRYLPWLAAAAGGAAWSLCFTEAPRTVLAAVALLPLLALTAGGGRRPFLLGWLHGTVHWLCAIPWLAATLTVYGGLPRWLAWPPVFLLCLYLGAYHGLFAALGRRLVARRRSWLAALLLLPAWWLALAWVRGHAGLVAFPWNLAAYAWVAMPGALPATAWVGSHGLSYLLLLVNAGLALSLLRRRPEPALTAWLLALLVLAVAGRFSVAPAAAGGPPREVRVVQPNVGLGLDAAGVRDGYRRLMALSSSACAGAEDRLLVWPESAAWPYSWDGAPHLRRDLAGLAADGCRTVLNSPLSEAEGLYNAALLVGPGGAVEGRYDKRRLVPWGEYVPLGELLPFVGQLARNAGGFAAGREASPLPWGEDRLGVAICYEVIFPELVAEQVRAGASLLVTVTNDGWYGDTAAPWQHFRAARFRAAENRRPLLRAALSGVSGIVDARGRLRGRLGVGEAGVLEGAVRGGRALSPYSRAPWLLPSIAALAVAFAIVPRRRR